MDRAQSGVIMRIDGHVHIHAGPVEPLRLLDELQIAGFDGAMLISPPPRFLNQGRIETLSSAERLESLAGWTAGQPTLFPLYWIDPTEPGALQQVEQAMAAGVAGFKVVCSTHMPCDPAAMPVYRAIAGHNKPILFHSGILWDGQPSSAFNRPAAFEPLLDVPHLRFSLAHMSWPWIDECLAVYGKFLNATTVRPDAPEMFVDLTPGTPPIYREEALIKLFTIGYDVADNVIFGTDAATDAYNVPWAQEWHARDREIMRRLEVPGEIVAQYFGGNLERWLSGAPRDAAPPMSGQGIF